MDRPTAEHERLEAARNGQAAWKRWGPYLAERQWGTVREHGNAEGDPWDSFPHDHARWRAYQWGEDGLAGMSDDRQQLCFAVALWNGRDPILKERLFGLSNREGNHGEDVKEYYFYLDATPTHSYLKFLYKYPHAAYPYGTLVRENARRTRHDYEFELLDTGVFEGNRYFDLFVEYAKAGPEEILARITVVNRGPEAAELHVLPTLWFRNTWSWNPNRLKPLLQQTSTGGTLRTIRAAHPEIGDRWLYCHGDPSLYFTENETDPERAHFVAGIGGVSREATAGGPAPRPGFFKDAFHRLVIHGDTDAVHPESRGTKAAAHYHLVVPPGESRTIRLRLSDVPPSDAREIDPGRDYHTFRDPEQTCFGAEFEAVFQQRIHEADEFYEQALHPELDDEARLISRQALAGLIWSKQYYHYDVHEWRTRSNGGSPPLPSARAGRNGAWAHLAADDIICMPDTWEYPWFASWDLAFQSLALQIVDPDLAREQLELVTRPRYMHPNGQLPAYEWNFSDVNPPVHAWVAWRLYINDARRNGRGDRRFLESMFHKCLVNFTWWVNRKDTFSNNIFEGGFLGLDNIGVLDRSSPLPFGGTHEQADGTAWMAMYALNLLEMALELAREDPHYQETAARFYEHFVSIAAAMDRMGAHADELWDEEDGFYYDLLRFPDGTTSRIKVRSLVGLVPLAAHVLITRSEYERLPDLRRRIARLERRHPELTRNLTNFEQPGPTGVRILSVLNETKLRRILARMLDEGEFLSAHGIRSLSRYHRDHPYVLSVDRQIHEVRYEPAESHSALFGGNSNWRGPVWFPINLLLCYALYRLHTYYGPSFRVECPTGSGRMLNLQEVSTEIARRLLSIFRRENGRRAVYGETDTFQNDPHWRDLILFYEYFHGDNGAGIGASHQTGWTALAARLFQLTAEGQIEFPVKPAAG